MGLQTPPQGGDVKIAFVTGGSSDIGAEIVRRLAAEGTKVAIADIDEDAGRKLEAEVGADALFVHCDLRHEDSVDNALQQAVTSFGGCLTCVVNNGAIIRHRHTQPFEETSTEDWDDTIAVNVRGAFLCTRAGARIMQEQGVKSGAIINISSVAGHRAIPFEDAAYNVSKIALTAMTKTCAAKLAPHSIRVNSVSPTVIKGTDMVDRAIAASGAPREVMEQMVPQSYAMLHFPQLPETVDVADAVAWLASSGSRHITGIDIAVDQGWVAGAVNMPTAE